MNKFIIIDKLAGGCLVIDPKNIISLIIGRKDSDMLSVYSATEEYKKSKQILIRKNLYLVENILNNDPFVEFILDDVELPIYVNNNFINYIETNVKNGGETFTSIDNIVYTIDGDLYKIKETAMEIKTKLNANIIEEDEQ